MEGYEHIVGWCTPAYSYVEGEDHEHYWVDSQNCWYYLICEETDEKTLKRLDGKKYWIIEPYKPKGVVLTEDNESCVRWLVTDTSEEFDEGKEWDFDKHCII